jgi:pyrroline-5-carboxylate reductase
MPRLAILGGGFMGGALAEGLIDSGWSAADLVVAEIREARRAFLEDHLKVATTDDALDAARRASSVLFAVKPQDIQPCLEAVAAAFSPAKLAISICAGVRTGLLERVLGDVPVIRAMPNTPAAIGQGATAIARGRFAKDDHLATALNILSTVGRVVVVDESQMDAVTAVSGTGPAYIFYLAEALISAAQKEGLSKEQAYVLVYQTFVGASELLSHDPAGPAELRARVTSPGGTTQAAMEYLEQSGWFRTFEEAVHRARERSEELGGS